MIIFEVGSLVCGVAQNPSTLIVGRAIAGLGGAGIAAGGFTILAFSAEQKRRPVLMGIMGATYGVSSVAGPLLGGIFSDKATWRWCFYINLPIGGVAAAVIMLFFQPPSAAKVIPATWREKLLQMDPVGVALTMGAITSFILALEAGGQTHSWKSSMVIGLLVGFVALLITLCIWELLQGERAMIVPRLFRKQFLWVGSIYQFCYAGAYYLLLYYLPIYFQSIGNTSPIQSGVRNLPMVISVSLAGLAGGITVSKTGHGTPFMVIGAALATVGTGLLYTLDIGTSAGKWIGYQILAGFAFSFPFQITMNIAQANAEPQDISSVTTIIFCKLSRNPSLRLEMLTKGSFSNPRRCFQSLRCAVRVRQHSRRQVVDDCTRY